MMISSFFLLDLQLQVNLQNDIQQPDSGIDTSSLDNGADDDIDAALSELQLTLGGSNGHSKTSDITHIPELTDYLRFLRCVSSVKTSVLNGAHCILGYFKNKFPFYTHQAEEIHSKRIQTLLVCVQRFIFVFV